MDIPETQATWDREHRNEEKQNRKEHNTNPIEKEMYEYIWGHNSIIYMYPSCFK